MVVRRKHCTKRGIANLAFAEYSCRVQEALKFDNAPAYDEDGRVVIKSSCRKCGESKLVSIRDGSLAKWESQHVCLGAPKIPPKFSNGASFR
jgi:hypothetical protein